MTEYELIVPGRQNMITVPGISAGDADLVRILLAATADGAVSTGAHGEFSQHAIHAVDRLIATLNAARRS